MDALTTARWRERLLTEAQARRAIEGREAAIGPKLRAWWSAVADVFKEYSRLVATGEIPQPPPAELAEVLAGLAGYLAVGQIPLPIRKAAIRGRTAPGPNEQRDIQTAVAYVRACGPEGLMHNGECIRVDDPDGVERVHLWFGAEKRTIYDWLRKYEPAFLGVNRIDAEVLVSRTVRAGERYRAAGRSAKAILSRQGKRRSRVRAKG